LTPMGVFLFAWVGSLYADIYIVKKLLKIGPEKIEFREELLPAWNPVGPIALIVASVIGSALAYGVLGPVLQVTSAFSAGIISFVLHIILAIIKKVKYYYKNRDEHPENYCYKIIKKFKVISN